MKYDKETTDKLIAAYTAAPTGDTVMALATELDVPKRSIIAKLSSLGIYERKKYLTKRGELPVKKQEYIERISALLEVNAEILESLEKVNKNVLVLLVKALEVEND